MVPDLVPILITTGEALLRGHENLAPCILQTFVISLGRLRSVLGWLAVRTTPTMNKVSQNLHSCVRLLLEVAPLCYVKYVHAPTGIA